MTTKLKKSGRVLWITGIAAMIGVAFLGGYKLWELASLEKMVAEFSPPPSAVSVVSPREVEWSPSRIVAGTLEAGSSSPLTTDIPGLVKSVLFRSGQEVRMGDVLLELDDSLEVIRLQGISATLAMVVAEFERASRLHAGRSISDAEWEAVRARRDETMAGKKELERILEKKRIRAPFDGVVGLRNIHPGRYLAEGDTVAELVSQTGRLIRFAVRVADLEHIATGTKVVFIVGQNERTAGVMAISPLVDPHTRQVDIQARIDGECSLPAGAFVQVRIPLGEERTVLTVPVTAIKNQEGRFVVFRTRDESGGTSVEAREVVLGPYLGDQRVIESGLQRDDRIVSIGNFKLRDGQRVHVSGSAQPEAREFPEPAKN